jgi:uncharacterized protein (UPF0333 family)
MMNAMRLVRKNKKGQSVVEFALVLPILLLLMLGIIEFGFVFHEYLVITYAASAALGSTDAVVITTVKNVASEINKGQIAITITPATRVRGNSVTVKVTNPIQINTPLISALFPQNPFPLSGTAIMRVE